MHVVARDGLGDPSQTREHIIRSACGKARRRDRLLVETIGIEGMAQDSIVHVLESPSALSPFGPDRMWQGHGYDAVTRISVHQD